MNEFEKWWYNIGSVITPAKTEDCEEHTKRVCSEFYKYLIAPCKSCTVYTEHKKGIGEYCKTCYQNPKRFEKP